MKIHVSKSRSSLDESSSKFETRDREGDSRFTRRRERPNSDLVIDYKDVETLRPFLMDSGQIMPARVASGAAF
ncbi:MAG: hypothetical protein ACK5QT_06910 [Oligoflexia bacterium]